MTQYTPVNRLLRTHLGLIDQGVISLTGLFVQSRVNPPFVDQKGASHLNTFLVFVPLIVVPAGFTRDNLPAGITFLGRPYDDGNIIKLAYAYEQATHHRRPPASTTPL